MSRYAWMVCEETKQVIWLGKMCSNPADGTAYFHIGGPEEVRNSNNSLLMRAVMKFLAANTGKALQIWTEEMYDTKIDDHFVEIGGEGGNSIELADYVKDFLG